MQIHVLIIDPQNDFCNPNGSLYVPGADSDMERLARMIERLKDKIDDIHITLDSHRKVDISHPIWWKDSSGSHPAPFTMISVDDLKAGRWTTTQPSAFARSLEYLQELARTGRYAHVIWPEHCLIGDEGHNVESTLSAAIHEWENRFAMVDFVTKGSNPWTEHFSAVQAEVPDPEDPSTQVNTRLIETLENADIVLLAGEARSHCVANTIFDVADNFGSDNISKIILLTDCTSDVPGFEHLGDKFLTDMVAQGMKVTTSTEFLA